MYQIRELPVGDDGIQTLLTYEEVAGFPIYLVDYAVSTGHHVYRWQRGNLELYRLQDDTAMRQTWYINGLEYLKLSDLPVDAVPSNTSCIPSFRTGMPTC